MHVSGVYHGESGVDLRREFESASGKADSVPDFFFVDAGKFKKFRVSLSRERWNRAVIVNTGNSNASGLNHIHNAGDKFLREIIAKLNMTKAQRDDFLDHLGAIVMSIRVPTG